MEQNAVDRRGQTGEPCVGRANAFGIEATHIVGQVDEFGGIRTTGQLVGIAIAGQPVGADAHFVELILGTNGGNVLSLVLTMNRVVTALIDVRSANRQTAEANLATNTPRREVLSIAGAGNRSAVKPLPPSTVLLNARMARSARDQLTADGHVNRMEVAGILQPHL